jgi:phage shock protein E
MFKLIKNLFTPTDNTRLSEVVNNPKTFLVDVRTPSEFSSGSVRGSVNIPLDKLPSQLGKFKGRENIVVFCRSGNRSAQAKHILEQNGFASVINGGTWQNVQQLKNK